MDKSLRGKTRLFGAWCGLFYCVILLVGWWVIGGFFPLHKPSAGPEEIAAFFRDDVTGIRIGMVLVMWSAAVFLPFAATLADYIAQIEGGTGPLSRIAQMAGFSNAMLTFYPAMFWIINAFRPDVRSPELIYLLNDIGWLQFIGGLALAMPMFLVVAVVALNDKNPDPVFPRWSGFASIFVFLLLLPDQLLFFFKSGPLAWNGLIAFWIPVTVFCGFFFMMFYLLRRAALRERAAQ
jgi:hypothetical protein